MSVATSRSMSAATSRRECRKAAEALGVFVGGVYHHYKGGIYTVEGIGWDTEAQAISVRYCSQMYPDSPEYYRLLSVFAGSNERGEPRFVRSILD